MRGVSLAVVANIAVRAWAAAISFLFIPIYLKALGPEGFGIVSLQSTFLVIVTLLDGGIGLTIMREIARTDDAPRRTLLFSTARAILEAIGLAVVIFFFFGASPIAAHWLHGKTVPLSEIVTSLQLIGAVLGLQIINTCYQSALFGIHRQVHFNMIAACVTPFRALLIWSVLTFVSATPEAFFVCYFITQVVQIAAMQLVLAREVPADPFHRTVTWQSGRELISLSRGVGLMSLLAILMFQADKLVASWTFPLGDFGYYMLAASASQIPSLIGIPVATATFPRISQLVESDRERGVELLLTSTQLVAAVVIPIGVTFLLFSREVLFGWTGNLAATAHAAPVLALLTIANSLVTFWEIFHVYEVASGRSRRFNIAYSLAIVMGTPVMIVGARFVGPAGLAAVWLALGVALLAVGIPIVMRKGLNGHFLRFYGQSIAIPLMASLAVAAVARLLTPNGLTRLPSAAVAVATLAVAMVLTVLLMPALRARLWGIVRQSAALLSRAPQSE